MNVEQIYQQGVAAGLEFWTENGKILVQPKQLITDSLRQAIRDHKPELIQLLTRQSETDCQRNIQEAIEERAAIQEYDGRLSRQEAEKQARSAMRIYQYKLADYPRWLVMLAPNTDLKEAKCVLKNRFGDRLINVKERQR